MKSYNLLNLWFRQLAPQCPYVEGSAVFKARALHAYYTPGLYYDDLKSCNNVGVYKSGNSNEGTSTMSKFEIESGYLKTIQLRSRDERETNNQELTIYPNPTSSILYFKVHSGKMVELEVFDIAGNQLIHEVMQTAQQTQSVDLTGLAIGIYNFKCITSDGRSFSGKFIKE